MKKLGISLSAALFAMILIASPAMAGKVDAFAQAYAQIAQIEQDLNAQLQQVEAQEQASQLQQQAQQQMLGVLEEVGLSVEDYNGKIQRMSTDAEFQQKVTERMQ